MCPPPYRRDCTKLPPLKSLSTTCFFTDFQDSQTFSTTYRFPQLPFRFQKLSTTSFLVSTTSFLVSVLNFHNFQYVNSQNFRLRRSQNTRKSPFESSKTTKFFSPAAGQGKITLNSTQVSAFSPVELYARRRRDFF